MNHKYGTDLKEVHGGIGRRKPAFIATPVDPLYIPALEYLDSLKSFISFARNHRCTQIDIELSS